MAPLQSAQGSSARSRVVRVLVCGGRTWGVFLKGKSKGAAIGEQQMLFYALHGLDITEIIHGGAQGADALAGRWARAHAIKETRIEADWLKYGRAAGPIRNAQMLELKPDLVVALRGGKGTADMVKRAQVAGIEVKAVGWELCPMTPSRP